MRITDIRTFLVDASSSSAWGARNWLFVKVETDEGIAGVGEGSGWPRVVQTAVEDLKPLLIGQDPRRIEQIWQRLMMTMMGHGMTGVGGAGAMSAIEMACWDILGKKLGVPVCDLLGGRIRERIWVYSHANMPERALELKAQGYTAIKTGNREQPVATVKALREAVGDEVDLCIDVHGPPWYTVPDAIRVGQQLEEYDLLFYEDPVPPENLDGLAQVAGSINVPLACGERYATIYGFRELIEREIADVIQPDTGRAGGLLQMKKLAAMAESHHIMVAPHDGSLGPVAEAAAVHLLATIPNFLILEHLSQDVLWRYEVATELPVVDGHIEVPNKPGLGVEIDENAIAAHPSRGNSALPRNLSSEATYVRPRAQRRRLWQV